MSKNKNKNVKVGFAIYPSVKLVDIVDDAKTNTKKTVFLKTLLFGDYIEANLDDNNELVTVKVGKEEYISVYCRGKEGYIKKKEMQSERPLEVNFIDVGQGDGCHIVTPDDKHFLVDAGKGDNMYRFLRWRFNLNETGNKTPGLTMVITHSDTDHYKGFKPIIDDASLKKPQINLKKIYHNGMVEGSGSGLESLGTLVTKGDNRYITDLCEKDADFQRRLEDVESGKIKAGVYLNMLKKAKVKKEGLRAGTKDEPVYLYNKNGMTMEIMGPVAEDVDGKPALRVFGDTGKTKNGHSVVIKLTIGHMKMLLGGDLNTESEYHLIKAYSGKDVTAIKSVLADKNTDEETRKAKEAELEQAIHDAGLSLGVDIAKSCHHGSDDFSSEFLRVLNPIATVISSGDDEPYCHPRPDTLGTIGKYSRGNRPMIYSTELARSSKEYIELNKLIEKEEAQEKAEAKKNGKKKSSDKDSKERVVTVYGMINVRTDGNNAIFAQKLERTATNGNTWDIHKLEWNKKKGEFELVCSKEK